MKKILITTNIITLLFLGLTYFTGCGKAEKLVADDSIKSTCTPCSDKVYEQVSSDYVKTLINKYRKNHWEVINASTMSGAGKVDSRSVWFDMDAVKSFIADVEAKTNASCAEGHCSQNLGIRIYFGEYEEALVAATRPEYAGLHTLIMVPTIQDKSQIGTISENVDFDPEHMTSCEPDAISSQWQFITALVPEMTAMNHGTLIPPPDPITGPCSGAKFMHFIDVIAGVRPATSTCP